MNQITPTALATVLETPDAVLLDVRQPEEFVSARVAGAVLIPLGELPSRLAEVPADTTVHVMCHAGGRSAQATEFLAANGYDVVNVTGGITEWMAAGLPTDSGPIS